MKSLQAILVYVTIWATSWQNQQCGCVPSEDSDQPRHPSSLIRVFAVRMKKGWILSYPLNAQRRLRSDWADAQADLSLRWAHSHSVGFVMRRLTSGFILAVSNGFGCNIEEIRKWITKIFGVHAKSINTHPPVAPGYDSGKRLLGSPILDKLDLN